MFRRAIYALSLCIYISDVTGTPGMVGPGKMMGIDTIHIVEQAVKRTADSAAETVNTAPTTVPIDKDTIITRNLKLERRKGKKLNTSPKTEEREPDWSYNSVPKEVSVYVEQFKKNMTECLKEVQDSDKRTVKRLSPKMESPVHGECLIACVLKRNAVIQNNKVNKDNLLQLVSKFFSKETRMMKKLEKNLDQCIEMSAHHHNECDLAAKLNECTNEFMASNKNTIVVNY